MRSLVLSLFIISILFPRDPQRTSASATGTPVKATLLNVNRLSAWYDADGQMERVPTTGNSGVTYPYGTSTAIYAAGMMMGGYVSDGLSSQPRVTGFSYNKGFVSGAINGIRTGNTDDPTDALNRIYRIRHDYVTADLKRDAAETNSIDTTNVTGGQITAVRAQYFKDWKEWPAEKGAPFYDADHDGKYTPQFRMVDGKEEPILFPEADEPGIAGADQVIYYVSNDVRLGQSPWKTPSIGIELQTTIWGYDAAANTGNGNAIYKRTRMIYKGTAATPDTAKMTEFYISQWSDPDLGDAGDDLAGCDSALGIGYVYNSKTNDAEYSKFSISAPSIGYILLQGPTVPAAPGITARYDFAWRDGRRELPLTSFTPSAAGGSPVSECGGYFSFNGGIQYYQNLRGLPQYPQGPPDPQPYIDAITGKPTHFVAGGDPVANTGWLDGAQNVNYDCTIGNPGDRRFMMSTGPFTMSLGDTQEVVYALVGGLGSDRLASVSVMKFFMRDVAQFYRYLYPDDLTSAGGKEHAIATQFLLEQNYPNPFNPSTTIGFTLPQAGPVHLSIFDGLGREIVTLVNGVLSAGAHTVRWDSHGAPSGVYYYRLSSVGTVTTKRMILMR